MINEDDIRRVRDATDIVAFIGERIVLKQRGREFWGCCPFHNEKTPSFKVDPASQFYHCFGCGEGGDVFKFLMKTENVDFPDAVRTLAQRANIEISGEGDDAPRGRKARLLAVCEETATFYHQQLMRVKGAGPDAARGYLAKRSMGGAVAREWRLGFAPGSAQLVRHLQQKGFTREELIEANVALLSEGAQRSLRDRFFNRIIFPISDLQGRTIAFGGRVIGTGEPKYLNSSDTPLFHKRDNLYAIDRAKARITAGGSAVVVEGYTDVIAMHAAGFANTVATLGTALTPQHLKLLARFTPRVVLLFDGDEAGQRAADRAAELIGVAASPEVGRKADLFVAMLPAGLDPADFCEKQGAEAMREVLDSAVPLLRFALDRRLATWDLTRPEQRAHALDDVVPLLVPVKGTLLAADYLNYLADVFAVDYPVVAAALEKAKPLPTYRAASAEVGGGGGAGSGAGAAAEQPLPLEAADPVLDKTVAFERELLFLFIEHPGVRARLREAFGRITWGDERHGTLAQALLELDAPGVGGEVAGAKAGGAEAEGAAGAQAGDSAASGAPHTFIPPDELLSRLTARVPQAAELLSGVRLSQFEGVPPNRMAGMLMFTIREGQLKQAIRNGNARLRRLPESAAEERDELFRHIAELQQELTELRKRYRVE
ncbi:MAG: DNA primase [Coriobacteriales bacterium]|jgi:DNA primase|nr:DNA primase [Coriobacteriales bacterium]